MMLIEGSPPREPILSQFGTASLYLAGHDDNKLKQGIKQFF